MNKPTEKDLNQKKNIKDNLNKKVKDPKNQTKNDINEKIISDLKIRLKDTEDKLLRELAENENLRKRHEKEKQENLKYAIRSFSSDLLSVTDNFERALNSITKDVEEKNTTMKNLVIGLRAVEKEIYDIFEKNGIKRFDSLKLKFDPEKHQAVSKIDSDLEEGLIVEELAKGFMIGDRLLRPAMVIVSSGNKDQKK
jgi:Molecular chaperone GrpE (heat shock protein)